MLRDQFLLEPGLIFLNHGSFGACPIPVLQALQHWQRETERNPVALLGRRSAELLRQARGALAAYLGAATDDLVFMPNATTGVNTVARSLALQAGDEVLGTDHEYGACDAAWRIICDKVGAHYRRVEIPLPFEPETWAQRLLDAATPRTRLIFASHITSTTALIFPVQDLCGRARERGIATLIDGAHAPGQIDLDLQAVGADFYTGNCHKWLCGPKGTAFLHVRPEQQRHIDATVLSWGYLEGTAGHTGFEAYLGHTGLERRLQWQGTRDLAPFLAVPAALEFLRSHDWPQLRQACHEAALTLLQVLCQQNGLTPIAADSSHGQMVPIPVLTSDPEALRQRLLNEHRIEVPVTTHGQRSFMRVSVQAYNTSQELEALAAALVEPRPRSGGAHG
ncbi:MAG TPA: aminotransferase class V-fold PLP-dependent enzyme [Rubrivivax sp.]|nr:aminotransferase class V-fold PLP-dependent enzyme [Rubrivivax sp.]